MFDNTQTVKTKEIADAIRALSGLFLTEKQLEKKKVTDRKGEISYICPGMITRILTSNDSQNNAQVFYIDGSIFSIDLTPEELEQQFDILIENN